MRVRDTYDPARPFGPWLVAIANRRIVDALRRFGRTEAREIPLDAERETFAAPETNYAEAASDGRALRALVERLAPGQREAIRLLKLKEMSLKEAAAASGTSVAALKVATHRGLGETARCFATLLLVGTPLSLAMLAMLRHAARLAPRPVAITASLAVAALSATALMLFHPIDASVMILIWNLGLAVLFAAVGGLYGRRMFAWVAPR